MLLVQKDLTGKFIIAYAVCIFFWGSFTAFLIVKFFNVLDKYYVLCLKGSSVVYMRITEDLLLCSEVSGDREVQRTMLELLNQLDGFSSDDRIKVSPCFLMLLNLSLYTVLSNIVSLYPIIFSCNSYLSSL